MTPISGRTVVAGVAGRPVAHSLSPLIHNAWLEAAGIDGVYVAFAPEVPRISRFLDGLRGGAIRGLNITLPFKEAALAAADRASPRAKAAAAANLLIFEMDGTIVADNTDGVGLLGAFAAQAPNFDPADGPAVVIGAGGAARGAVAALAAAGTPQVRIVNRALAKAQAIARVLDGEIVAYRLEEAARAFEGAAAIINATSGELCGQGGLEVPLEAAPATCVAMDMIYRPLDTGFLKMARALSLATVDGLEMLIGQARPAFEAFYGAAPPPGVDVRSLALKAPED